MKAAVVIATAGRVDACEQALVAVDGQIVGEDIELIGVVSAPTTSDLPRYASERWTLISGTRGASAQRNAALDVLPEDTDVVFFFDDDALPRADYVMRTCRYLQANSGVIATTGTVLADGAKTRREIDHASAVEILEGSWDAIPADVETHGDSHKELYGCNSAVRWTPVNDLRFDERLPLYSWLEDHDLARRLLRRGRIHKLREAVAVHRGSNSGGRTAHIRFGYSQVANPLWLREKGSFSSSLAARELLRPVLKNLVFAAVPGSGFTMRRERLLGNLMATRDTMCNRGRAEPERILELKV